MEKRVKGTGKVIKDTWVITRGCGNQGKRWRGLGWWSMLVGGIQFSNYLNNNEKDPLEVLIQ